MMIVSYKIGHGGVLSPVYVYEYGLMACEDFRSGPGSGSDEWLEALAGLVRSVEWQM